MWWCREPASFRDLCLSCKTCWCRELCGRHEPAPHRKLVCVAKFPDVASLVVPRVSLCFKSSISSTSGNAFAILICLARVDGFASFAGLVKIDGVVTTFCFANLVDFATLAGLCFASFSRSCYLSVPRPVSRIPSLMVPHLSSRSPLSQVSRLSVRLVSRTFPS